MGKNKNIDMTNGPIIRPLIVFTIPLILGNVFQLTYNAVDSIIVGRFIGEGALAAVGTAMPLTNIMILLISGMCMGASVLISSAYGAQDYEQLEKQISTILISGIVFSLVLSVITIFFAENLLLLIKVPSQIMEEATDYLRIVFLGLVFTFIYNFLANTMRALGDSKTPLIFLMISALINVFGDIFFILVLEGGVKGCALATLFSEMICCILCGIYIWRKIPMLHLGKKWFVFEKALLKKTVTFGSTSAMQQVCLQIGKIIIQGVVNSQGVSVMAAFTAVSRMDDFAYIPQQNIGHGMTTFIAQNKGAGKEERIKKGFIGGMMIEYGYSIVLLFAMFFGASIFMKMFLGGENQEAISLGKHYLQWMAFFYLLPAATNGIQGFFRGIGDMKVTLQSTFMNMLGRVFAVILFIKVLNYGFVSLAFANVIGWIVMLLFELPLLRKVLIKDE